MRRCGSEWWTRAWDRELLQSDSSSRVVMIASAGCNALDSLLDSPAEVHALEMNPRQNALLELKTSLIHLGDFDELFRVFGDGVRTGFRSLLRRLAATLSPNAWHFWQRKHSYFEASRLNPSFTIGAALVRPPGC